MGVIVVIQGNARNILWISPTDSWIQSFISNYCSEWDPRIRQLVRVSRPTSFRLVGRCKHWKRLFIWWQSKGSMIHDIIVRFLLEFVKRLLARGSAPTPCLAFLYFDFNVSHKRLSILKVVWRLSSLIALEAVCELRIFGSDVGCTILLMLTLFIWNSMRLMTVLRSVCR